MVVTIAIIAVAVVGIAYGFSAVVRSAGDAQEQATLDAAAQYVAGYLQSDIDVRYRVCTTSYFVAEPHEFASTYPQVEVDGSAWPESFAVDLSVPDPGLGYSSLGRCSADYGVQEITFTVSDGPTSVSRTVWKGDQS
jgi:type II secretory pathway pseudopilin PulG